MNPRLERLIELWSHHLDDKLEPEDRGEFEAMMRDSQLVEELAERQLETASAEPEPEINWKKVDRKASRFSLKAGPDILVLFMALAIGGLIWGINTMLKPPPEEKNITGWSEAPPPKAKGGFRIKKPRPISKPQPPPKKWVGPPPNAVNPLEVELGPQGVSIYLTQEDQGLVELEVIDLSGGRIRRLYSGNLDRGRWSFAWDGRQDSGRSAVQGRYEIRLTSGQEDYRQPVDLMFR